MKKYTVFLLSSLISSFIYGSPLIIVECRSDPNMSAYVFDPVIQAMQKTKSCGEALAHVPDSYSLISGTGAGGEWGDGIKYLFSEKPADSR